MTAHPSLLASAAPTVGLEIASHRIGGVVVEQRGAVRRVVAHAVEPLPAGAVVASLTATNLSSRALIVKAITKVLGRLGTRARRIGLVVPDSVAKVSLVRFDKVPDRSQDLDQLIRWQVRKTAPFQIEDAQVSYTPGIALPEGGREFVVALARRAIVAEYEAACSEAGVHAGIVDLATFNVINAVLVSPAVPSADWLLVHVTPDYASMAVLRGRDLIFFRQRTSDDEASLADLVHQTAMYYEDRLSGAGFARVLLSGAASTAAWEAAAVSGTGERAVRPDVQLGDPSQAVPRLEVDQLRRNLEERLGAPVESVDPREAAQLMDRIVAGPALLDDLAPAIGLIVRETAEAA